MAKITIKYYNILYIHVYSKTLSDGSIVKQAKPYYDGVWNNETFSYASNTTNSNIRINVKTFETNKGWRWTSEITSQTDFFNKYDVYPTPKL